MAFSIKSSEADALARDLATVTGESLTEAVTVSLRERLARERSRRAPSIAVRLRRLAADAASLPQLDDRDIDDILGYDEHGLPA